MKKPITASLLIALTLAGACSKSGADADPLIAKIDKHGDEIMASNTKAEARAWMTHPHHIFFKADPKQVAQFIEDFYQAGADKVYIADIEEEQGNYYGEGLLVILPKDAAARAKLFEVESRADTAFQDDSVTDKGQKYLYNSLD